MSRNPGTLPSVTAQLTAHFAPWDTISHTVTPSALQYHQQLTCFQYPTRACPELVEGDLVFTTSAFLRHCRASPEGT